MLKRSATRQAARLRVSELLQLPVEAPLDLADEPILVAGLLLQQVIGDRKKCYFVTSYDGRLKWNAQTLSKCMGYDRSLAIRAVKSAGLQRDCPMSDGDTPRLQALRQTTLDELRKLDTATHPCIAGWGSKPTAVKCLYRDILLRSYQERQVIKDILDEKRGYPSQLSETFRQLGKWSQNDLRCLKYHVM